MKEAMRFELNGKVYEKNEKGNRFFVSDEANGIYRKRIGEAAFEKAWEEFVELTKEEPIDDFDAEKEIEERKNLQEKKDREAEDNFNGKKEEPKKTAKPRKSKDIAFEMDTLEGHVTLTEKQVDFIKHVPDTCFYENGLESTMWCDILADEIGGQFAGKPMTVGAMISTLREKHLVYVSTDKVNGRKAKFFGFTELGKMIAEKLGLQ